MTAVDTNVLVRLLTGDDPAQERAARLLFESGRIWIAKTVLLETAWVLRSLYGFEEEAIRAALTKLLGLRNVSVEDAPAVAAALAFVSEGIEFADAIHLASRPNGATFVSFAHTGLHRMFAKNDRIMSLSAVSAD
jgi:predicted nucleic-acid-binding protein